MCTHDLCFRAKIRKYHKFSSENYHFYIREILQYIVWACFRNDYVDVCNDEGNLFKDEKMQ